MWFFKDFVLVVVAVIMSSAAFVNLYGIFSDWSNLQQAVYKEYGLTWVQLLYVITTLGFVIVAGKLVLRVNAVTALYDSTSRLRHAKRLLNERAAAALDLANSDSLTEEAVVTLLGEAADKVTELLGRYDGEIFREMTSNFLNPAIEVAGDRKTQALRSAAGWLNARSNSMTSLQIMDLKP